MLGTHGCHQEVSTSAGHDYGTVGQGCQFTDLKSEFLAKEIDRVSLGFRVHFHYHLHSSEKAPRGALLN